MGVHLAAGCHRPSLLSGPSEAEGESEKRLGAQIVGFSKYLNLGEKILEILVYT